MNQIRTGYMTGVREINKACVEACMGRGATVRGEFANHQSRITRARTHHGVLQGRTMNGEWEGMLDAKAWD